MKKISIMAAATIVAVSSMVSCNGVADSGEVKTSLDTLSMTLGESYG